MEKIRIALIGAGGMANSVHYPSLAEFDDVEIVGLCDLVAEKLRTTADRFQIENRFTNYKKMIRETDPHAVYVLMPPQHLFDPVMFALQNGKHVFIEKPPAITLHQITEMARRADQNNCKTMVGFNRRFIPLLRNVKSIVEENGPIIQCMATFHKNSPNALYYDGVIDVLTCDAIHAVDALRWLGGGKVKAIASDINAFNSDRENSFNAIVKFDSGASGYLCTNWAVGRRIHTFEMHACGVSAYVNPDLDGKATIFRGSETIELSTISVAKSDQNYKAYGFFGENRHFVDCLKNDLMPETNFADAIETMKLVDLIYQNRIA